MCSGHSPKDWNPCSFQVQQIDWGCSRKSWHPGATTALSPGFELVVGNLRPPAIEKLDENIRRWVVLSAKFSTAITTIHGNMNLTSEETSGHLRNSGMGAWRPESCRRLLSGIKKNTSQPKCSVVFAGDRI